MKAFAGLTILSIILGTVVVEFVYLGLDALYPYASTSAGERGDEGVGVATSYGELSLTAFAFSPSDVKLTLSLVNYRTSSYDDLTVWIADLHTGLPEGFELVTGNLSWYGSAEVPEVNLEATIRAVKDGKWRLTGAALWYHGGSQRQGSGTLDIIVSNGKVADIRVWKSSESNIPLVTEAMNLRELLPPIDLEIPHDLILTNNNVTRFYNMTVLIHGNVKLLENATLILDNAELYVFAKDIFLGGTSTFIALGSVVDPNTIRAEDHSNLLVSNTHLLCGLVLQGSAQLNLFNSSAGPSNLYDYSEATIFNSTIRLDVSSSSTVRIHNCNSKEGLGATGTSNVEILNSTIEEVYLRGNTSLSMFSSKATYLYWTYYRGVPLWNGSAYFHWQLTVNVVDSTGSPIPNAEVKVIRVNGDATEHIFNGTTNSEGIVETYLLEKIVRARKILMGGNETIAIEEEILNNYKVEAIYNGNSASTTILIDNEISIQLKV
ncbi:MAG: hypothetical protein JSV12_06555 [Candidatus Bathyarchaeota archaeon]|nr:MAG: hypothetical protein JSV12_06555 [Candidatus Bathyarchaeota archaeon]